MDEILNDEQATRLIEELEAERDSESRWAKRYHDALVKIMRHYNNAGEKADIHAAVMAAIAQTALQGLATDALPEENT